MTRSNTNTRALPDVTALKSQARRLRDSLTAQGTALTHSAALELLASQFGFRDWNTLRAAADTPRPNRPTAPVGLGDVVTGRYLDQPFKGKVLAIREMADGQFYRVTLQFDEPVDVVTFESFSAPRRRVSATISASGRSPQHTSDGKPQIQLDL